LKPVFESEDIIKIIHNSQHDCALFKSDLGFYTRNIFDTMNGEKLKTGVVIPEDIKVKKEIREKFYALFGVNLSVCLQRRGLPDKFEFEPFHWYVYTIICSHIKDESFIRAFTYKEYLELTKSERRKWTVKKISHDNTLEKWTDNQCVYGVRDVEFLHEIMEDQYNTSFQLNQENTLALENKVAEVFYLMTCRGFGIDVKGWLDLATKNERIYDAAFLKLKDIADINWQAPGQACKYFGVKYIAELEALDLKTPAYKYWKEARGLYNYTHTYGKNWIKQHVDQNGRVHCSFNQIVNTGRCSSNNPNLQNVPALTKTIHRTFFKPRKGNKFGIADFKGQELAIIAKGSGEKSWLDCLRKGEDLHSMTGERTFKDRWTSATGDARKIMRRKIKDVNFGIAYGMGAEKFGIKANITLAEAEQILFDYKAEFKDVMRWLRKNANFSVDYGISYSMEPFNRRRVLALEDEDWRKANIGKNNPVQATGADMTKLAMVYMHQEFEAIKYHEDDGIIHQLHDELIVEWPAKDEKRMLKIMRECMVAANVEILGEKLGEPDLVAADSWVKPD
jgi:DNA polymerase I-like protein with 3'-5' exonuclease and polymerase domains